MTVYVFPGQGSQKIGMGETLFGAYPELLNQANEILGYDLAALCLNDVDGQLNQTQFTQPALYVVNAMCYFDLMAQRPKVPNYVMGHSLGEYNALLAAGVFDFATGLRLVQERGRLMSLAKRGGMMAVIGLSTDAIQSILAHHANDASWCIANYNSLMQSVISGPRESMDALQKAFEQSDAKMVVPLAVSGAFHSPLMQEASQQFKTFLQQFEYKNPKIPVIANTNAKPYEGESVVVEQLAHQMTQPVLWTDMVQSMLTKCETEFVEVGPGKVLSGLIRRIQNQQ